jgi:hypothetical protein
LASGVCISSIQPAVASSLPTILSGTAMIGRTPRAAQ